MSDLGDNLFSQGRASLHAETPHNKVGKSRTYGKGRTCVEYNCDTPISMYNKHKTCWLHTPVELYVNRGRRSDAQAS